MARLCHTAGATQSAAVSHDEPDDATAPGHDRDTTTCNLSLRISAAVVARKLVTPYPTASDKLFRDVCHWGAHVLPRPFAISWHNAWARGSCRAEPAAGRRARPRIPLTTSRTASGQCSFPPDAAL